MNNDDQQILDEINHIKLVDHITIFAFLIGVIIGIVVASFLHKYIVHPLGW